MSWLDLTETKETSFDVLPAGEYILNIAEAELKNTQDDSGQYIKCKCKVLDEDYKDRVIFTNFNIKNKSEKARSIGLGQLKKMMRCAGKDNFTLNSPKDLEGLVFVGKVAIRKDNNGNDQNEIKDFKALTSEVNINFPKSSDIPF